MASSVKLTLDDPLFRAFVFYATVNLIKMMCVTVSTAFFRITKNVFATPEDTKVFGPKGQKPVLRDDDVERARRSHRNDLENIPVFLFLSFFYIFTGVSLNTVLWHFRIFTVARILFSICYQMVIPAPSRSICFLVGTAVIASMAVQIIQASM